MKKIILSLKQKTIIPILLLFIYLPLYPQAIKSTQPHEGKVNAIFSFEKDYPFETSFYSVGNDGFIIKWAENRMGEHYQVSDLQARLVSKNPISGDIAIYETDGISTHRITMIDSNTYEKKFSLKFANSIVCMTFSSQGNYLLVGTTAVNGVFALDAETGAVIKKADDISGIVPLILTGKSEKSSVMYSKSGMIYYYDLSQMKVKSKFPTVSSLEQTILFGTEKFNNRFFAGVKDNTIYIIDATSGKTLSQYQVNSPIIFTSRLDEEKKQGLYFIYGTGKNFSLEFISQTFLYNLLTEGVAESPVVIKRFTGLQAQEKFSCVAKKRETIMLGTNSGNIYTIKDVPEDKLCMLSSITDNMYEKIYDVESGKDSFYFLTKSSLFKTPYNSRSIIKIGTNSAQTNMLVHPTGMILWSKGTNKTVQLISLDGSDEIKPLFTPSSQLMSLRLFGNRLVYILGTSTVGIYDIPTGKESDSENSKDYSSTNMVVYTGTSIQDAVLIDKNTLIIAKTVTGEGDSPLIYVNTDTQETVPLNSTGSVAFSLCFDDSKNDFCVYGILLDPKDITYQTQLFSYDTKTDIQTGVLGIRGEDNSAFAKISYPLLLTNMGKNQISAYNIFTQNMSLYKRSASMPLKAVVLKEKLAVLNYNGSISWYNIVSSELLSDWYFTTKGEWFEF